MIKYENIEKIVKYVADYLRDDTPFRYEKQLLNEQIRNTDVRIILDIGSGDAKYFKSSAKSKGNRDRIYIAIDTKYQKGRVPDKRENIEYIAADTRYLPFKDESIDLTTSFHFPYGGGEIFSEMLRVTKSDGRGINNVLSDRSFGIFPCEPQESERLKTLFMESIRVGHEHYGSYWYDFTPRPEELSRKYDEIKDIMSHPVEDIFDLFGLNVIQKNRHEPKWFSQFFKPLCIILPEFIFPIENKTDVIYNTNEEIKYPQHSYVWIKRNIDEGRIDEGRQIVRTDMYSSLIEQLENHFQIDANESLSPIADT